MKWFGLIFKADPVLCCRFQVCVCQFVCSGHQINTSHKQTLVKYAKVWQMCFTQQPENSVLSADWLLVWWWQTVNSAPCLKNLVDPIRLSAQITFCVIIFMGNMCFWSWDEQCELWTAGIRGTRTDRGLFSFGSVVSLKVYCRKKSCVFWFVNVEIIKKQGFPLMNTNRAEEKQQSACAHSKAQH